MTLLGKIFTLCIFIASLFLMFVAMVVYATHRDWRADYNQVSSDLQEARAANQTLESKYLNQIALLNSEHEVAQQEIRKLESELETVTDENTAIQTEIDELRTERREAETLVKATELNNNRLMAEVEDLRSSIRASQAARDRAFSQTLEATSELHTTAGQLEAVRERSAQLIQQLASATSALREFNIDPNADVVVQARGKILLTRRADGGQLIEVSIGEDDGVRPRQTIEIYRGQRYLGRAEVLEVDPDRAVARVIRQFQQGVIQEGDDVATRLRVN